MLKCTILGVVCTSFFVMCRWPCQDLLENHWGQILYAFMALALMGCDGVLCLLLSGCYLILTALSCICFRLSAVHWGYKLYLTRINIFPILADKKKCLIPCKQTCTHYAGPRRSKRSKNVQLLHLVFLFSSVLIFKNYSYFIGIELRHKIIYNNFHTPIQLVTCIHSVYICQRRRKKN